LVTLNDKQLTSIARFNREFRVRSMTIENVENEKVEVRATLATASAKVKAFYLDVEGGLAGIIKET
jgi:hypothetical protein